MGRDGTVDLKSREYWPATKRVFRMLVASKCLRTQNYLERHGVELAREHRLGMTVHSAQESPAEGGREKLIFFFLSHFESMTDKELDTRQFIVQPYC